MNIAIFGDAHGKILLAFKLCARWQQETGQKIEAILQAGDLGVFPDYSRLDDATIRYAQKDPDELGFMTYFMQHDPQVAAILAQTTCPMLFVRGNHEDHDWLDQLEEQSDDVLFPIDAYQRIYCLKSGLPYTISAAKQALTILGIGRVGTSTGRGDPNQGQFIQPHERKRLQQLTPASLSIDLLLTHDSARDFVTEGYGMSEIRQTLNRFRPLYHFYGHTGKPANQRLDTNGSTQSCQLSDLGWQLGNGGIVRTNAMALLRWQGPNDHAFEIVNEPWMREYSMYNWLYV